MLTCIACGKPLKTVVQTSEAHTFFSYDAETDRISELTLQRPIWLDKETDYGEMEQFKKLKPEWYCKDERHIHTRKISGLQLLAVMEEIMLELRYGRTLPCPVFSCHEKEYYKDTEQLIQHLEAKHPRSLKKHGVQKLIEMSQALA